MSTNLYKPGPLMIDSGTFWRCRHGRSRMYKPCVRCGIFHPYLLAKDLWWFWR